MMDASVELRDAEPSFEDAAPLPVLRVLVVQDGSTPCSAALAHAIRIASGEHAALTIAQVADAPPWWAFCSSYAMPFTREDLRRASARAAESALAAASLRVPSGISLTTRVLLGPPWSAVSREAVTGRHDLVVMGCRLGRRSGTTRLADAVLRRCQVPVLVVPAVIEPS